MIVERYNYSHLFDLITAELCLCNSPCTLVFSITKEDRHNITKILLKRVWRYQRGNQNPYFEKEQTTQCPKEKGQRDRQWSTKHTHKTKDRVTQSPLKTGGELMWSGRVSSSCSTSGISRVNLGLNTHRH